MTDNAIGSRISRRDFLKTTGVVSGVALASPFLGGSAFAYTKPIELVHWSWLAASDGDVWAEVIKDFNAAHAGKGIQINLQLVPEEQYTTKLLTAAATGQAPDFGWGTAGKSAMLARDGVTVPLDKLVAASGLNLADFSESSVKAARYPKYDNQLFMVPLDLMSLQPEINLDHVAAAGLDPKALPATGEELIKWAKAMTQMKDGKVSRSGIMMTGSGVQPTVTWGIVAEQMGFERASADLKTACVNPEAGIKAMEWVLALFDEHKVSTRDVTDRYKAFGTGEGSIFWTGPWTLNGYVKQGLNFKTFAMPNIGGKQRTYFEMGGMELYTQGDTGRYEATMEAVRWLSDNSFKWTTVGRGASPRASILNRPDYKSAGIAWDKRGAFIEGMEFANIYEVPVVEGSDFTIYNGGNFLATTLESVWAGSKKPADAMAELQAHWQKDLDKG